MEATLVIFGGAGDLARRKLFPALYNLRVAGLLGEDFSVIGVGRREVKLEEYRQQIARDLSSQIARQELRVHDLDWIIERLHYIRGDTQETATYEALSKKLAGGSIPRNAIFYLATPPALFSVIPQKLSESGLLKQDGKWRRIVIEKPFGRDFESARCLNQELLHVAGEDQIYRIDHYLGKETVQNMMVLRFANGTYEPIWNRRYVDCVQITVAESLGVEDRAEYYDHSGALRDMVPNHLFQLMSLVGMEPPNSFDPDDVRNEKVKLLQAIKVYSPEDVLTFAVRGQYKGYQGEVKPGSATETFAALKLEIDNWRWAGVPFYLRTGKRLAGRQTEVMIRFRRAPIHMFREADPGQLGSNVLAIQIQPDERIQMRFNVKIPGPEVKLGNVTMDFDYKSGFGTAPQTGYETLLFDCMKGDPTLFQRADQIETGWKIVQPILDVWGSLKPRDFPNYAQDSWGPDAAECLLAKDGRFWLSTSYCELGSREEAA